MMIGGICEQQVSVCVPFAGLTFSDHVSSKNSLIAHPFGFGWPPTTPSPRDHRVAEKGVKEMTVIKVDIDERSGRISVFNDGPRIPVEMHKKENVFVPELIFGHLLTSSNYDDSQTRFTGGRHGFGAKLTNIFSSEFTVEIYDSKNKLHYRQRFTHNMGVTEPPEIRKQAPEQPGVSWTRISFKPDLARFHQKKLDPDHLALLFRRV